MLNYLTATDIEIGLLLNFGPAPQFRRLIFENERKKIRVHPRKSAEKKFADSIKQAEGRRVLNYLTATDERKKIRVHPRKSAEKKFADSVNKPKDEEC